MPTTAAASTTDTAEPVPKPDSTSEPGEVTTPAAASCGDFDPIPPIPDSMPTLMYDTDGDGNVDDEVTAYAGGGDGWVLRIVQNGATSEAQMPGIDGWAYISNDYQIDGRDYIEVTDNDDGTIFTLATVKGCVEVLDTRSPIDDIATPMPTPPDPLPTGPTDLSAGPPECTLVAPIPGTATIVTDLTLDLAGDGVADDQVITYVDSGWIIRSTVDGVTSEVGVAGVGAGSVRALGAVDVGELSAGNEIIATTGAGASATVIGIYGFDNSGCIYAFSDTTGSPLSMTAGASIGSGSRFLCGTGYVAASIWNLEADDTYSMYSYALVESSPVSSRTCRRRMTSAMACSSQYPRRTPSNAPGSCSEHCAGQALAGSRRGDPLHRHRLARLRRDRTRRSPRTARRMTGDSAADGAPSEPGAAVVSLAQATAALDNAEERPGQLEMARLVEASIASGRHLVVQAGTGTGKTLAYLVPAITGGKRVVVATATKALQDQLANKDLPFLADHLDVDFDFAVLKGRSNYVCLQRLKEMSAGEQGQLELDTLAVVTQAEIKKIARMGRNLRHG